MKQHNKTMKHNNKKQKRSNLKLWRHCCKRCGNKDENIERAYDAPFTVKLCPKCGHEMLPKETIINLSKGLKGVISIKF